MKSPRRIELTADHLDEAGLGVGVAGGLEVHVADLLPGEAAEVELAHTSTHRSEAWAVITTRRGALSADRTTPYCPAFGQCGGCAWQHLAYPAQLAEKRRRVAAALRGLVEPDAVPAPRPAPATTGYRNKGKYVVGGRAGAVVLGAYAPRSHRVVDTAGCRVVAPVIDEVAGAVRVALDASGLAPWDEGQRTGAWRYVIIRASPEGQVLVALVTRSDVDDAVVAAAAQRIAAHPAVRGVTRQRNDRLDGALLDGAGEPLFGAGSLSEPVGGARVEVGAGAFLQINRAQSAALYAAVAELGGAGPGVRAVDLYCGLGGIAFTLAAAGAEVTGVERDLAAVAAATAAAEAAGLAARVRFVAGDAAAVAGLAADLLVVNPPRKGLGAAAAAVAALAAPTLVYVSCGPASLGADLAVLAAAGYRLEAVQLFDLMPGTAQIETVAVCRRSATSR